ncbi:hypothetical protein WA026_000960 [Henosepilachna vigintioctopunctata]|uniref:Lipocalin/cytosolic fatty-acid binding domain-containing protein n=1 Tax=Henosepilachna vigintioctopunctata TaxID=420089 RepID=A0AAW1VA34_9CUCU
MYTYSVIFVLCFYVSYGQVLVFNQCPDLPVQRNFDVEKFMGNWYERNVYTAGSGGDRCNLDTFRSTDCGSFNLNMTDAGDWLVSGRARPIGAEAAKLVVDYFVGANAELPYWILETDYNSYAVAWSCLQSPAATLRYAWVLTRNRNSEEALQRGLSVFEKLSIDTSYLKEVDQNNCSN